MPAGRVRTAKQGQAGLRLALREDWAARRLRVEYQPQVNLRTRRIVRFEALLRWSRPGSQVISPKAFIPLAEEMGIIGEIGQWVLARACADAQDWPPDIGIAVNAAATVLRDPALPAKVAYILSQSGLAPSRLELEITESSAIIMDSESFRVLDAIQKLGVRITIDDLDTGHAALRYLLYFPFDKIKLDVLYAASIGGADRREAVARQIMRAIAGLCENLRIDSLAEGVETAAQLEAVMAANFTEVQGFIFGEAVPASRVAESLAGIKEIWNTLGVP